MVPDRYDALVVGAGPAGCVLANRLTEDPDRRVLLLEAGPDYGDDLNAWPVEMRNPVSFEPESHSWGYQDAGRSLSLSRTRVVGGSSAINSCLWLRGSASDYDQWAAAGNPKWTYDDLLPYFCRSETDPIGGPLHGTRGPVPVHRMSDGAMSPIDRGFASAAMTLGFPPMADLNGEPEQRACVGPTPRNVANGMRMHAAATYLVPARHRVNLTIEPNTMIDRVLIRDGMAVGVRTVDGQEIGARQTILSAGTYGTPAILLRSGIGPAAHLRECGIEVVVDLPGVGRGLSDHPRLGLLLAPIEPDHLPAAQTATPSMIKACSTQTDDKIDLHIYQAQFVVEEMGGWVLWMGVSLQQARSQGTVELTSIDPFAPLAIDHRYLSEQADVEALCDGAELVARLIATPSLATLLRSVQWLVPSWKHRDTLREIVREHAGTTFHPSSSCQMGPVSNPSSVVDSTGSVHGVPGLRIVDASIFPTAPRANLHCTVVAVAERLADTIRTETSA